MDRRNLLMGSAAFAATGMFASAAALAQASRPAHPNILFVLVDNLGYRPPG